MSTLQQRQDIVAMVDEAVSSGARRHKACALIGLAPSTLRRWRPVGCEQVRSDARPEAVRLSLSKPLQRRKTAGDTRHVQQARKRQSAPQPDCAKVGR